MNTRFKTKRIVIVIIIPVLVIGLGVGIYLAYSGQADAPEVSEIDNKTEDECIETYTDPVYEEVSFEYDSCLVELEVRLFEGDELRKDIIMTHNGTEMRVGLGPMPLIGFPLDCIENGQIKRITERVKRVTAGTQHFYSGDAFNNEDVTAEKLSDYEYFVGRKLEETDICYFTKFFTTRIPHRYGSTLEGKVGRDDDGYAGIVVVDIADSSASTGETMEIFDEIIANLFNNL